MKIIPVVRVALVCAVLSSAAFLACGPVKKDCSSATCPGCCDTTGTCQIGSVQNACGVSGTPCNLCTTDSICSAGTCLKLGTGNKKDGGTQDDAGNGGGDGGGNGDGGLGGDGGFNNDAGVDGGGCSPINSGCSFSGECCSGYCSTGGVCSTPPPQDAGPWIGESCANAEPLTFSSSGTTFTAFGTGSTQSYFNDGSSASCGGFGADRVYVFTTTAVSDLTVDLNSVSGAPLLFALRASDCATEVSCGFTGPTTYAKLPAGTYYLWIDTEQSTGVNYSFSVELKAPAFAGDTCSSPITATFSSNSYTATGNTTGYTNDISTTASGCSSATGGDVIYTFFNPGTADLSATVTTTSSTYRPVVYFRAASCTGSTTGSCGVAATGGQSASTSITAQPSGTYYVIVDGAVSTNGPYTLTLTRTPTSTSATGESCAGPIPLTFTGSTTQTAMASGTTLGAAHDHNHSCASSTTTAAPDRVYTFTTTMTKSFSATVTASSASNWDVGISLYGAPCTSGMEYDCADASGTLPETVSYTALPPGTYYLWIDGYSSSSAGSYTLNVTLQ